MHPAVVLTAYCVVVGLASLAGGWIPGMVRLTHLRKQLMMSLVAGVMLGIALLHMLPMSIAHLPASSAAMGMLCGVLVMFFLLRVFHVHSHDGPSDHRNGHSHGHSRSDAHAHDHPHQHGERPGEKRSAYRWGGILVGMTIHSLLDGAAMAASIVADEGHGHGTLLGFGTFLAVVLHKPLDSLAVISVIHASDQTGGRTTNLVNGALALTSPVGAALFWLGASQLVDQKNALIGLSMAFSAGFFLCIALSDLLPEVSFHSHDRIKLSTALLLGVAAALGVESTHSHNHYRSLDERQRQSGPAADDEDRDDRGDGLGDNGLSP